MLNPSRYEPPWLWSQGGNSPRKPTMVSFRTAWRPFRWSNRRWPLRCPASKAPPRRSCRRRQGVEEMAVFSMGKIGENGGKWGKLMENCWEIMGRSGNFMGNFRKILMEIGELEVFLSWNTGVVHVSISGMKIRFFSVDLMILAILIGFIDSENTVNIQWDG